MTLLTNATSIHLIIIMKEYTSPNSSYSRKSLSYITLYRIHISVDILHIANTRHSDWLPASYMHINEGNVYRFQDSLSTVNFNGSHRMTQKTHCWIPSIYNSILTKTDAPHIWVWQWINQLWLSTLHKVKLIYFTMQNNSLIQIWALNW